MGFSIITNGGGKMMTELPDLTNSEAAPIIDERRTAWLLQRQGKFTASEFHKLCTSQNKPDLPAGAITYIFEKVAEILADVEVDSGFTSRAMQWGIDTEVEAIAKFSEKHGVTVDFIGNQQQFLVLTELCCGGTPDGLIGTTSGVEIKCPNSATHLKYLGIKSAADLKEIEQHYYWQVLGSMLVSGRSSWYFVSYDPRFHKEEHRFNSILIDAESVKDDMEFLKHRLELACSLLKKELTRFS